MKERKEKRMNVPVGSKSAVTFGSALAISISWSIHHSVLWAIVHGFFSWLYVIYYVLTR
ncbi:hypothetical protein [Mesobacillus selenatarsenatis]|uniref:Uncharacterized protein n=1 Tax=Mesobacillus selenatarsenatis TaxID=388741 RepID=A0A846TNQ1_9BACI|nr:hypothetical protein [Mesobacillus selenatarsenatis]NKE04061.1 hypothetical protein [Mesobacillus selenatarsenatis]